MTPLRLSPSLGASLLPVNQLIKRPVAWLSLTPVNRLAVAVVPAGASLVPLHE